MKKKVKITLGILLAALVLGIVWYRTPVMLSTVNPEEVSEIYVFGGMNGKELRITDAEEIAHIIGNFNTVKLRRNGISLFRMGYRLNLHIYLKNGKAAPGINDFIMNGPTIRKDPFFYEVLEGEVDYRYIEDLMGRNFQHPRVEVPAASEVPVSDTQMMDIPFRCLHRGFTAIQLNDRAAFEAFSAVGTKVIGNDEDWHDYMDRFCPGIPCFDSVDFAEECLLASVTFGARPAYNQARTLTRLSLEEGQFVFGYEDDPAPCLALNSNGTTQFYVEVLIVPRENLPENLEELTYHPAPAPATMEEILAGEGCFYSEGSYMTLDEFCADFLCPAWFTKIAAADLSQDGEKEVILWLSGEDAVVNPFTEPYKEGVLVLHQEGELVHGDFMAYHELYDLKADGTFRWFGKHGSSGIAYADSRYGFWCQNPVAAEEKKDYSSPDDTMIRHADRAFFSLDKGLSEEDAYRQAMAIQAEKEDARWFDFPGTALDAVLQ